MYQLLHPAGTDFHLGLITSLDHLPEARARKASSSALVSGISLVDVISPPKLLALGAKIKKKILSSDVARFYYLWPCK